MSVFNFTREHLILTYGYKKAMSVKKLFLQQILKAVFY